MSGKDLTSYIHERMPFCATLGLKAEKMTPEEVVLSLDWAAELCTAAGMLHGGALMALADSAGGAAAFANLPEGASGTSTIESKTNFLGAMREGTVIATARPLHVGGSTIVIETELRNNGKLIGKVTQTQTVLRPRT
ncbi:MAG: PaaI family thioesterase [Alphaproteobacteria bacterium]|nr:MAG: PaaI family thioesterase [Alphaproteobacteria bacterium]